MRHRILFVVNNPAFFLSHRLPIALAAQQAGYEVHVATPQGDTVALITAHGIHHHVVPITRQGKNFLQEALSLFVLVRLFRRLRPTLVHLVTIKPVLYGGVAARLARVPAMIAAISGLGFVFISKGFKARLLRSVVTIFYRLALKHKNSRVILQNPMDSELLISQQILRTQQIVMVRGSGIDLNVYQMHPEPSTLPIVVTMASRLLADKGIREFVEAACVLHGRGVKVHMQLAGAIDLGNPASILADELEKWIKEGKIFYLGECNNIAEIYSATHIVVLPSYREGLPKSLIEASACGRAVVTTDVPGCRDAIEPNVTGLLVPVQDSQTLAKAIERLVNDPILRQQFGQAGRRLAEREFDIRQVVQTHLELYNTLCE